MDQLQTHESTFPDDDVISLLKRFLEEYQGDEPENTEVLKEQEKTFTVDQIRRTGRTLQGTVKVGRYGEGADHYNIDDEDREVGARGPYDAVERPYYFLFHLPERNKEHAVFIIYKPGNLGAKGVYETVLEDWIEDLSTRIENRVYHEFEAIVEHDLMEQIEEADRLLTLTLSKKKVASAPNDRLGSLIDTEKDFKQEITFKHHQGQSLPLKLDDLQENISSFLPGGDDSEDDGLDNHEPSTVGILDQTFNDAKLSIEEETSTRTLSFTRDGVHMEHIFDPEEENVSLNEQEHPVPEDLSALAIEFANEILDMHYEENIDSTHTWD